MNLLSDHFWFTQPLEESLQITHSFLKAFATAEDFAIKMTIAYLSREYLAKNAGNPETVARVLLEETEDDRATITKEGQTIQIQQATFTGTNGNDTLNGTSGDDTFYPGRGNDSVDGAYGNDLLVVDYSQNTYPGGNYTPGISSYVYSNATGESHGYFRARKDNNGNYDRVSFEKIERFQVTVTKNLDKLDEPYFQPPMTQTDILYRRLVQFVRVLPRGDKLC